MTNENLTAFSHLRTFDTCNLYFKKFDRLQCKSFHVLIFKTIDRVHFETNKWLRLGTKGLSKNFNWYICNFRKRQTKRRIGMLSSRYQDYSFAVFLLLPLTWVCPITSRCSGKRGSASERAAYIDPTLYWTNRITNLRPNIMCEKPITSRVVVKSFTLMIFSSILFLHSYTIHH